MKPSTVHYVLPASRASYSLLRMRAVLPTMLKGSRPVLERITPDRGRRTSAEACVADRRLPCGSNAGCAQRAPVARAAVGSLAAPIGASCARSAICASSRASCASRDPSAPTAVETLAVLEALSAPAAPAAYQQRELRALRQSLEQRRPRPMTRRLRF